MIALIGLPRGVPRGWSAGERRSCSGRSGDALTSTQSSPFAETARLACVRGRARGSPAQASWHTGHRQFHCGKPPPAAEPSTIAVRRPIKQNLSDAGLELGRQVAVDLETNTNLNQDWGRPHDLFLSLPWTAGAGETPDIWHATGRPPAHSRNEVYRF